MGGNALQCGRRLGYRALGNDGDRPIGVMQHVVRDAPQGGMTVASHELTLGLARRVGIGRDPATAAGSYGWGPHCSRMAWARPSPRVGVCHRPLPRPTPCWPTAAWTRPCTEA